jgi:aconitate hydratase 2/2-methylisocitrate dehydratase
MTSQELESMAATVISPIVDGAYQSGCHTASVWDKKAQANIPKLMKFMNDFGLITARDPKGEYHAMTDVIHKVLNDITVDEWAIIIGGDSHTRMSKGVAFGADSGTVALALAQVKLQCQSRICKSNFQRRNETTWISVMWFMLLRLRC